MPPPPWIRYLKEIEGQWIVDKTVSVSSVRDNDHQMNSHLWKHATATTKLYSLSLHYDICDALHNLMTKQSYLKCLTVYFNLVFHTWYLFMNMIVICIASYVEDIVKIVEARLKLY